MSREIIAWKENSPSLVFGTGKRLCSVGKLKYSPMRNWHERKKTVWMAEKGHGPALVAWVLWREIRNESNMTSFEFIHWKEVTLSGKWITMIKCICTNTPRLTINNSVTEVWFWHLPSSSFLTKLSLIPLSRIGWCRMYNRSCGFWFHITKVLLLSIIRADLIFM
jgi:hypothetical protein